MTEQQNTFIADMTFDTERYGYRLHRLEIKNFGGYHGPASVFHFDLEGAVFSGDNGAGKSTAIDAYRMLFRTQPRFNSATDGAKDRSVETYYLGQYGKKDGAGGGRAEVLRDYGVKEGFMAICGVFKTDQGETFSALRMAYFPKKGDSAEWRLITAENDLSIERDFPAWPTPGQCARAAQALGGELHKNYRDFFAAIGLAFGIDDPDEAANAFQFIDQSIGVKKLGSIASFARDNIFPRNSLRKSADGAITAFEEVQEATRQIARTEAMIEDLQDVTRKFGNYDKSLGAHKEITQRKLHFTQFGHMMNAVRWNRIARRNEARYNKIEVELAKASAAHDAAEAEIKAIQLKISNAGYDQVDNLKEKKRKLLMRATKMRAALSEMTDQFKAAGMSFDGSSLTALEKSFTKVAKRISELEQQISDNQAQQREADYAYRKALEEQQNAESAYRNILQDRSAINTGLVRARAQLADALQMRTDELPFVAELAKVSNHDAEWEGVANRVLGGIGSQLLVESRNLGAARRFLASKKFPGIKVVLHEVKDLAPARPDLHADALAHKIEIKSGDRFEQVARVLIDSHADHVCMDALSFETTKERFAVIKEGSVKNGLKTIKDDRYDIADRSNYILGWNIEDRIELAEKKLRIKEQAVAEAKNICDQHMGGITALNARRDKANQLLGARKDFDEIDVGRVTAEIESFDLQISALDDDEAEALRQKRSDAEQRKHEASTKRDELNRTQGSAENTMNAAKKSTDKAMQRWADEVEAYGKVTYQERRHYLDLLREMIGAPKGLSVFHRVMVEKEADMDEVISEMRRKVDEAGNSALTINRAGDRARRAAEQFMRNFPESDLSTDVVAENFEVATQASRAASIRQEWEDRLDKLKRDDLPRHKASFEERHKSFAVAAVQQIESEANNYARRIKKLEKGFNAILSGLTYDPMEGTRAKLRIHPRTENEAVQKFRSRLKIAVDNLYNEDDAVVERLTQGLIDLIKVDGDSKSALDRREAILDLRNWFTMDVEEFYVDDAGEYAEQRRIYAGQDGASGGQGERLTMLLIGAAMSYTFGAGDDSRQVTGLQTIMLDEAFMHGSEEMAAAATDVLVAMGLQVIAATPVQKLQAFAGKTERVFSISKRDEQILHTDSTYAALEELEKRENARFEASDAVPA